MKSSIALVALLVAAIGLGGAVSASAQDASSSSVAPPPAAAAPPPADPANAGRPHHQRMGRGQLFLTLACSDKGSAALDHALVRLDKRLDLTADQQPLFDAFHTKAVASEATFAQTCVAAKPDATATAKPDLLAQVRTHLAIDTARTTALNDVLPDFAAFYASLTDAQKADLMPRHGHGHMSGGAPIPTDPGHV